MMHTLHLTMVMGGGDSRGCSRGGAGRIKAGE